MKSKIVISLLLVALICAFDAGAQKKKSKAPAKPARTTATTKKAQSTSKTTPKKEESKPVAEKPIEKVEDPDLDRTVTIERNYNPIVRDASKINTLPQVDAPVAVKTQAEYATWTVAKESDEKPIKTLDAGQAGSTYPFTKQMGWLNFAGGNYTNLKGSAGIWFLDTPENRLGLTFDHQSTNGDVTSNQGGLKLRAKSMDNIGRLAFTHHFEKLDLNIKVDYTNSSFNYYGTNPISSMAYSGENQQHNNVVANIGVGSGERKGAVEYAVNVGYSYFDKKHLNDINLQGVTEGIINVNGEVAAPFQEVNKVALEAEILSFYYNTPAFAEEEKKSRGFDNYSHLTLTPSYQLNNGNFKLKLGARLAIAVNKGKTFLPAPDVKMDWTFSPGYTLFGYVGGGVETYSFANADRINRYINPGLRLEDVYAPIDANLGLKGDVGYGFYFELFGGYKWFDNNNFFIQYPTDSWSLVSNPVDLKSSVLKFGAQVKYKYQNYVDFSLKVQKNNWNTSYKEEAEGVERPEAKAWNMPGLELNAGINSYITKDIVLSLDYYLGSDRTAYAFGGSHTMDNINDLSLSARYSFLKRFTVSGKIGNLLNSKYDIYYGMPTQGFNFMIGAGVRF